MSANKARSRKRSAANSGAPPESRTFYLIRNFGRHLFADGPREVGHAVEVHDDHLPIDAPDDYGDQSVCSTEFMQFVPMNVDDIESLNCIRDTLLPKLLSGELTIPDAEKLVADAV